MRLFTSVTTILVTLAFSAYVVCAQDSPIIINDNGNIPLILQDTINKSSLTKKKGRGAQKRPPGSWSFYETHVHFEGSHGIQQNGQSKEIFIEESGYSAVCFEDTTGNKFMLDKEEPWSFFTTSRQDNTRIHVSKGSNHVHIDMGKSMYYNPPYDLDDPDPASATGKKNQLIGGIFNGILTPNGSWGYSTYQMPFIIHYCGPQGCKDSHGVDQCAGATLMNAAPKKPAAKK